jgi:hypothetical protein
LRRRRRRVVVVVDGGVTLGVTCDRCQQTAHNNVMGGLLANAQSCKDENETLE